MPGMSGCAMLWTFIAFALMLALVAFVLALVVYFRERRDHKHVLATFCKSKKCCCRLGRQIYSIQQEIAGTGFMRPQAMIGEWSYTDPTFTGTNAPQNMLFAAATPQPGVPVTDAQLAASSVLPTPYAGFVTALTVEANAVPTVGSATFVVTVNGVASVLTATLDATATTPFATSTAAPGTGVAFAAGDLIGISFSSTSLSIAAPPTFTSQLFGNFR